MRRKETIVFRKILTQTVSGIILSIRNSLFSLEVPMRRKDESKKPISLFAVDGLQKKLLFFWLEKRQDVLSLQIAVHHDDRGSIIVQIADDCGKLAQSGKLGGPLAPVTGYDLILAVCPLADDCGNKNAVCLDTLNGLLHLFIVPHLKGMVGKVMELGERDVDD